MFPDTEAWTLITKFKIKIDILNCVSNSSLQRSRVYSIEDCVLISTTSWNNYGDKFRVYSEPGGVGWLLGPLKICIRSHGVVPVLMSLNAEQ